MTSALVIVWHNGLLQVGLRCCNNEACELGQVVVGWWLVCWTHLRFELKAPPFVLFASTQHST
jgi:hypothetical protein